ncbi:MAG: HD domain-containing protein, partial [Candidatus Lokiarchaeota archaeon]|nr:HD domain-containing protein [Candidatus Lokiarchaeota archaeon]
MMLPAAEPRSSELLAKNKPARITLLQHTRDVMVTVLAIHDSLPPGSRDGRDMLKPTLVAALFHDLGKAHPDFQKLLRDEENHWSLRRHEIISAGLLAGAIYSTGTRCLD